MARGQFVRSRAEESLTSSAVLTAAHCLSNPKITAITITLDNGSEVRRVRAKSWVTHPSFDPSSAVNDIGVIRLALTVPSRSFEPIATRFSTGFPQQGKVTTVIGFGYTSQNGPLSDDLRRVQLTVRDGAVCDNVFASFKETIEICAGGLGKVPCSGDSGGPMVVIESDGTHLLAGIVSYGGDGCNEYPAVFTRVSAFQVWIAGALDSEPNKAPALGCFAGSNSVEVRNRGPVRMQDLKLGDEVMVGQGKYEPIYSFGHVARRRSPHFCTFKHQGHSCVSQKITWCSPRRRGCTSIFSSCGRLSARGSGLKDRIESIEVLQDTGLFAPFTPSGKLIVNDILASSYVAVVDQEDLNLGWTILNLHWLSHAVLFPRRLICCHLASCPSETYNSEGIPLWIDPVYRAFSWLLSFNSFVRVSLIVTMAVVATFVTAVETWIWFPAAMIALCMLLSLSVARKFHIKIKRN
ncbi:serine-type endopeptidase [Fragilaria crotonensis]|nr:serine-type endopeptidase [Fragilaria crotonensis]